MQDLTPMFALGDTVPSFTLPDTEGAVHAVPGEDGAAATVLVISCNHCPYVVAWNPRLRKAAEDYAPRGVRFLAIHPNDAGRFPADSFEHMQRFVREHDWPIPFLHDEAQDVARALGAERTPEVYVLDADHRLVYHGAPDGDHEDPSRNAEWLRAALDAALAGEPVPNAETPARGCSVKWR